MPAALKLLVRRALSGLARRVLRVRSRPFPLEAGSRTLILSPHQDDETLGCGGLIPQLLATGHQVSVTYITDGSGSHPGWQNLAEVRRKEALAATALLGLSAAQIEFLGARDGSLAHLDPVAAAALTEQITATLHRQQPTMVLLPCRADGSSEHNAAHALFARALAASRLSARVLEFPIWSWWNPLLLRQPLRHSRRIWRAAFPAGLALKRQALAQHISQVAPPFPGSDPLLSPAFISFFAHAEEFFFEQ